MQSGLGGGSIMNSNHIIKKTISTVFHRIRHPFIEESGFSLKGLIFFILFVGLITFIAIHLIRPVYCSGRFKTALNTIAADSFLKCNRDIQEEILNQAEKTGVFLEDENIAIHWGPQKESLEIKIDYTCPVDFYFYRYDRSFSYTLTKKMSYPQKRINRTSEKLDGSFNKMKEKARKAQEKLEY